METTTSSPTFEMLQAFWMTQPRAMRLITPELRVRWDNLPGRLDQLPLYRDARGRAVSLPPPGPARNAWPVMRALAEGERCMRNYRLPGAPGEMAQIYRVQAYPLEVPGEGLLIVEETERTNEALCPDERLRDFDAQLSDLMARMAIFLTSRSGGDLLRLRLSNANLQPCHESRPHPHCGVSNNFLNPEAPDGSALDKPLYCSCCDSYLLACPDPLTRIGENINRLLSFLQLKYQEALEIDQQVQHFEKLAALGELTMGIVHEIKNPLSIIASRLDCLVWEADPQTGANLDDDLAVLRHQITRMQQFLEDLLVFSRPATIQPRPVNVNEAIHQMLPLLSKTLEKAQIRFDLRLDEDLPPIWGDPVSIRQVLLNLALNARDATAQGGRIRISSRQDPRQPGTVLVEVCDNGHGIEPDKLKKIFSPFYSTKAGNGGTGLGLAVCSRIMDQHGGAITVRSRLAEGSTFTLSFKGLGSRDAS